MRLSRRVKPFDSDQFIYELKIDGFRALPHIAARYQTSRNEFELIAKTADVSRNVGPSANRGVEVYVEPFPPTGEKHQITRDGGDNPLWSPEGNRLFYLTLGETRKVMAIDERKRAWHLEKL
jgi:hypothetical protein